MMPFSFSVSVTGHRTLSQEHLSRITTQVRQILGVVRTQAEAITTAHATIFEPEPQLRVVSCLSEGADRLVAWAGIDMGFRLGGILPFPRNSEVHAHDLEPNAQAHSRKELHALLDVAESVLELAPEATEATGAAVDDIGSDTPLARAQRQQAYAEAGIRMLEYSDVLIAVWHGAPQPMPGSSAFVIERAVEMGMPVVWVHACNAVPPALYTVGLDGRPALQLLDDPECQPLQQKLEQHFAPPLTGTALNPQLQQCIDDYERTFLPKPFWYSWWEHFFSSLAPAAPFSVSRVKAASAMSFSALAGYYGNLHRSFFLLACLMGTLAVCVATLSLALPVFNWQGITQNGAKFVLGVVELGLLFLLWRIHAASQDGEWQRKFTDYRLIAEHLRHAKFLHGLGLVVDALPSLPYYADNPADWVRWYIRMRVRQDALPSVSLADMEYVRAQKNQLLAKWLEEQQLYHTRNAHRSHLAEERLHHLVNGLFWITGGCVVLHLALKTVATSAGVITLLGVLTILLPLWAMAAHALGQYAEFRRLHDRSAAMSAQLEKLCARMAVQTSSCGVAQVARGASSLMLHEAVEWKVQYRMPQVAKA